MQEADIIPAVVLGTVSRFKYADFPTPVNDYTGVGCVVSYPKERLSFIASLKPLSYQVSPEMIHIFSCIKTVAINHMKDRIYYTVQICETIKGY